jgi:hypothetical protein
MEHQHGSKTRTARRTQHSERIKTMDLSELYERYRYLALAQGVESAAAKCYAELIRDKEASLADCPWALEQALAEASSFVRD